MSRQMIPSDGSRIESRVFIEYQTGKYGYFVRRVLYIALAARPEISTKARILGTFLAGLEKNRYIAAHKMLGYIQGTDRYKLMWRSRISDLIHTFFDHS